MGAAREGAISHIPSVGFSLLSYHYDADFTLAAQYAQRVISYMLNTGVPDGTYLNVNIPDLKELKGLKVVRQSAGRWVEEFVERTDPRKRTYYWLTGHFENLEPLATDTDEYALANGYVSVVPCHTDSTLHSAIPHRITSYNVCYTKLLRLLLAHRSFRKFGTSSYRY